MLVLIDFIFLNDFHDCDLLQNEIDDDVTNQIATKS